MILSLKPPEFFEVNTRACHFLNWTKFTQEQLNALEKLAREFEEQLAVVTIGDLTEGWEEKLLGQGLVSTAGGCRALKTVQEIQEQLHLAGEISFTAKNDFYGRSPAFVETLKK